MISRLGKNQEVYSDKFFFSLQIPTVLCISGRLFICAGFLIICAVNLYSEPVIDPMPLKSVSVEIDLCDDILMGRMIFSYRNDGESPLIIDHTAMCPTKAVIESVVLKHRDENIPARLCKNTPPAGTFKKFEHQVRPPSEIASISTHLQNGSLEGTLSVFYRRMNRLAINISPLPPSESVEVVVSYAEIITPKNNVYRVVYPSHPVCDFSISRHRRSAAATIALNRYEYNDCSKSNDKIFNLIVSMEHRNGIDNLRSCSHKVNINNISASKAVVTYSDTSLPKRNLILEFHTSAKDIEVPVILSSEDRGEHFFLSFANPLKTEQKGDMRLDHYRFFFDFSSSISSSDVCEIAGLMESLLLEMKSSDSFEFFICNKSKIERITGILQPVRENISRVVAAIRAIRPSGEKSLLSMIEYVQSLEGSGKTILFTDGLTDEELAIYDFLRSVNSSVRIFAIGIGPHPNGFMLDQIAAGSGGDCAMISDRAELNLKRLQMLGDVSGHAKISLVGDSFSGYSFEPPTLEIPAFQKTFTVLGKWLGASEEKPKLVLQDPRHGVRAFATLTRKTRDLNSAIASLWARARLGAYFERNAMRYARSKQDEIFTIEQSYRILSPISAFNAKFPLKAKSSGNPETVHIPSVESEYSSAGCTNQSLGWTSGGRSTFVNPSIPLERSGIGISGIITPASVSSRDISGFIMTRLERTRSCFNRIFAADGQIWGTIGFDIRTADDGSTVNVVKFHDSLENEELEKILESELRQIVYPVVKVGGKGISFSIMIRFD